MAALLVSKQRATSYDYHSELHFAASSVKVILATMSARAFAQAVFSLLLSPSIVNLQECACLWTPVRRQVLTESHTIVCTSPILIAIAANLIVARLVIFKDEDSAMSMIVFAQDRRLIMTARDGTCSIDQIVSEPVSSYDAHGRHLPL